MKYFLRASLVVFLACVGCGVADITYFEHQETLRFTRGMGYRTDLNSEDLRNGGEFTDAGVLFVPYTRELAWSDRRAFVVLYSKDRRKIEVEKIVITDDASGRSATLTANETIRIETKGKFDQIFHGFVPASFGTVSGANEVFSGKSVTMDIHYTLPPSGKPAQKRFILKKKIIPGQAVRDILAAS